jgi:predicted enzyme related to lactoylglutathione lyase
MPSSKYPDPYLFEFRFPMQLFPQVFYNIHKFTREFQMNLKSIDMVWIVVNDFKSAIQFYTETVGLKLAECNEDYGWAELEGHNGGTRLGIAKMQPKSEDDVKPGQNAVMTFTVTSLEKAVSEMKQKGAKLIGAIEEIPGHVKMQMAQDSDGNRFQLVEVCHQHKCCHC